jgi:hypothetical protein
VVPSLTVGGGRADRHPERGLRAIPEEPQDDDNEPEEAASDLPDGAEDKNARDVDEEC